MKTEEFTKKLHDPNYPMMPKMERMMLDKAAIDEDIQRQRFIGMEECAELSKEISKFARDKGCLEDLIQEIADVLIVIDQQKIMHNINDDTIEKAISIKMNQIKENS